MSLLLASHVMTATIPSKEISIYDVKMEVKQLNSNNQIEINYDYKQKVNIIATAYTASKEECGNNKGITASGQRLSRGMIATHPSIPFNTILDIDSVGRVVVTDRGGALHWINNYTIRVDIYMPRKKDAIDFGIKNLDGYIYRRTKN